jgi:phage terminase large subunit
VQTMNIVPGHGNVLLTLSQIVLNKFPEGLLTRPEHIIGSPATYAEIMRFLKTARLPPSNEKEICWFIDGERPEHNLHLITHSTFQIHEFLDPARVLIGITYAKKDTSRNRIGYPEFGVNQTHVGITKSGKRLANNAVRVRSDAMNHSINGGYT